MINHSLAHKRHGEKAMGKSHKEAHARKAITKPNLTYLRWRYVRNAGRTIRAWLDRPSYSDSARIAGEISDRGIVVGASEQYLSEQGRQALSEASDLVLGISRQSEVHAALEGRSSGGSKDYLVQLIPFGQEFSSDSPLLRVALDKKLLEIVSLYLGMWPRLNAIAAWLNFPSADEPKQSQLWHRDPEDLKIIKVFIYLVDVDENRGPFCYIPKTHPFGAGAGTVPKHAQKKTITDEEMRAAIPADGWMTCTGPANTMVLADTVGYHRGGKPRKGNRILITFTYTSGTPLAKARHAPQVKGTPSWATHAMQRHAL
jgi:hypothetical protein